MSLIAHPIKSIPSPHLEASQFCLEKSNMDTLRLLPAEYPSPSTERSPLLREVVLEFHRNQRPHSLFPGCGSRQVATSCLGDGDHPRGCKLWFPLWTGCLPLLSHGCSPAAHAWGNKDGLSPRAKLWCLLLLSQYNTVGWKHTLPYLLYYFERCATISFGLLKQKTWKWCCYSSLSSLPLLIKSALLVLSLSFPSSGTPFLAVGPYLHVTNLVSTESKFWGTQLFVALNFPLGTYCCHLRWLAFYPQKFSLNGLPVICLCNFGSL